MSFSNIENTSTSAHFLQELEKSYLIASPSKISSNTIWFSPPPPQPAGALWITVIASWLVSMLPTSPLVVSFKAVTKMIFVTVANESDPGTLCLKFAVLDLPFLVGMADRILWNLMGLISWLHLLICYLFCCHLWWFQHVLHLGALAYISLLGRLSSVCL